MDLKIDKKLGEKSLLTLHGAIDTSTSPVFESAIKGALNNGNDITLDFADVSYVSSAGLRVLLIARKAIPEDGLLKLINVSPEVKEVLDLTGFSEILQIE